MDKNKDALDAFERILKDAFYGINSGDHEIMNPENYEKEMSRCCGDRQTVLNALQTQAELVELLKSFVEVHDEPCRTDHHGYCQTHFLDDVNNEGCRVANAKKMIARAEGRE